MFTLRTRRGRKVSRRLALFSENGSWLAPLECRAPATDLVGLWPVLDDTSSQPITITVTGTPPGAGAGGGGEGTLIDNSYAPAASGEIETWAEVLGDYDYGDGRHDIWHIVDEGSFTRFDPIIATGSNVDFNSPFQIAEMQHIYVETLDGTAGYGTGWSSGTELHYNVHDFNFTTDTDLGQSTGNTVVSTGHYSIGFDPAIVYQSTGYTSHSLCYCFCAPGVSATVDAYGLTVVTSNADGSTNTFNDPDFQTVGGDYYFNFATVLGESFTVEYCTYNHICVHFSMEGFTNSQMFLWSYQLNPN